MAEFDVVAEARLSYSEDEMTPESAKENLREMLRSGEITPSIRIEWEDEEN